MKCRRHSFAPTLLELAEAAGAHKSLRAVPAAAAERALLYCTATAAAVACQRRARNTAAAASKLARVVGALCRDRAQEWRRRRICVCDVERHAHSLLNAAAAAAN